MNNYEWIAGEILTYKDKRKQVREEILASVGFVCLLIAIMAVGIVI